MKVTIDRMQCVSAVHAGIRARRSLCRMKRTRFRRLSRNTGRMEISRPVLRFPIPSPAHATLPTSARRRLLPLWSDQIPPGKKSRRAHSRIIVRIIRNRSCAKTACGLFAGRMIISPAPTAKGFLSICTFCSAVGYHEHRVVGCGVFGEAFSRVKGEDRDGAGFFKNDHPARNGAGLVRGKVVYDEHFFFEVFTSGIGHGRFLHSIFVCSRISVSVLLNVFLRGRGVSHRGYAFPELVVTEPDFFPEKCGKAGHGDGG